MEVGGDFGGEVVGTREVRADDMVVAQLLLECVEFGGLRGVGLAQGGGDGGIVFEVDEAGQAEFACAAILGLGDAGAVARGEDADLDALGGAVYFVERGAAGRFVAAAEVLHADELRLA